MRTTRGHRLLPREQKNEGRNKLADALTTALPELSSTPSLSTDTLTCPQWKIVFEIHLEIGVSETSPRIL